MHELTHVYNNYLMLLKGNENFIITAKSDMYRNITDTSGGPTEKDLKQVLYFLLGYERNAFVAQLKGNWRIIKVKSILLMMLSKFLKNARYTLPMRESIIL